MSYLPSSTTSDSLAVSTGAQVRLGNCLLCNAILVPAAAASALTLYDNSAGDNSGKVLAKIIAPANGASVALNFSIPVIANNGISYVLSGSAATAVVSFIPQA